MKLTSDLELEQTLEDSTTGFRNWRELSFDERGELFARLASKLEDREEEFAKLIALEMGKPLAQGEAEVKKCASACNYYAKKAEQYLLPEETEKVDGSKALLHFDPIGAVFAIMPWNFPFWQVFRFAAPSMMAGNVALLKHAPSVPQCALAIEELFISSGFPPGSFSSVFLSNEQAASVIADKRIQAVTLTGSVQAGSEVAALAGRNLKRVVLELGGSDPFIVLEDADLEKAAKAGALSRCLNSGQVLLCSKNALSFTRQ